MLEQTLQAGEEFIEKIKEGELNFEKLDMYTMG